MTVSFRDMKYARGGGPSFLKLQGNVSIAVPGQDVQHTFLWGTGSPSLDPNRQRSSLTRNIVTNPNVKYLVNKLFRHIRPEPDAARETYRGLLTNSGSRVRRGVQDEGEQVSVTTDTANEGVVVRNYQGISTGEIEIAPDTGFGPLPEDESGRPLMMQAYVVEPTGLFRSQAEVARLEDGPSVHRNEDGTRQIKYRKLKPDSRIAEYGAFPLLYPYGDIHKPYDMKEYVAVKDNRSSEVSLASLT